MEEKLHLELVASGISSAQINYLAGSDHFLFGELCGNLPCTKTAEQTKIVKKNPLIISFLWGGGERRNIQGPLTWKISCSKTQVLEQDLLDSGHGTKRAGVQEIFGQCSQTGFEFWMILCGSRSCTW